MFSSYERRIADLCNIPIGNVRKLMPYFFNSEEYVLHLHCHYKWWGDGIGEGWLIYNRVW